MTNDAFWSDYLRRTLHGYDEPLLRQVAAGLFKPRSQWPVEDLIDRSLTTLSNAAVIDRRLQDLDTSSRRLMTLIAHSRQPRWRLGNLLELLAALGLSEGPRPVLTLFEAGLLYPDLRHPSSTGTEGKPALRGEAKPRLKSFEQWLGGGSATGFAVFAYPAVMARALGGDLGLPDCPHVPGPLSGIHEADGLEWLLHQAALWQLLIESPLRRTQQGDFFKRDLDRLRADPLLNSPPADNLTELPDAGLLAVALAQSEGLVQGAEGELRAGTLPPIWEEGLFHTLASLWSALLVIETWNPLDGWCGTATVGNPYPSAYLLTLLLLSRLPEEGWARPGDLDHWIHAHHPFWKGDNGGPSQRRGWVSTFLLGLAYQLRMLQAAKDAAGGWVVRLSPLGRWLLGLAEPPAEAPPFPQTLLVQPNLEIVVYRQGLTPGLIARLSRFATWKNLGAACTLQLQADTIYRALESGLTFETILQTLEQQGMRAVPPSVVESLRTWADKRERISIYPSATLFEFGSADDLNAALARGLPGIRLSERLLAVANESAVDFRHFRLTGTRDYGLPPEKCVEVDSDGVTLAVDLARSDLLLETEIQRFAEPLDHASVNGRRRYRLTPASLANSRESGLGLRELDDWFLQRAGCPLSPAGRLLLTGAQNAPLEIRSLLVLHVANPELADGLLQWPGTRPLIQQRLGPTALVIAAEDAPALRERLASLGIQVRAG
jgi:hypothetical protein